MFGGTEKEGAVDLEDFHSVGDAAIADCVGISLVITISISQLSRNDADIGDFSHPTHKKESSEDHPDLDCNRQVDDDRERERRQQHDHIALRSSKLTAEGPPLAHVISHYNQNRGESRKRNEGSPSAKGKCYQQKRERVNHTRYRSAATILDVRCCTRDCSCSRNSAKERRGDIGNSLCHQLHVGPMPATDHSISYYCRQQ